MQVNTITQVRQRPVPNVTLAIFSQWQEVLHVHLVWLENIQTIKDSLHVHFVHLVIMQVLKELNFVQPVNKVVTVVLVHPIVHCLQFHIIIVNKDKTYHFSAILELLQTLLVLKDVLLVSLEPLPILSELTVMLVQLVITQRKMRLSTVYNVLLDAFLT